MEQLNGSFVWGQIRRRNPDSHKGTYGTVLAVAGSALYRGAASLTVEGALRTGAGIVTLASVEPVVAAVAARLPECCFLPCAAGPEGGVSAEALGQLLPAAEKSRVLLLGPGLGNTGDTKALVENLLPAAGGAVVLDADGLNGAAALLAEGRELPRPAGGLILTPHPGEMSRLTGQPVRELEADREQTALSWARRWNCVLVLKGSRTIVAAPDGRAWINTTGNPGLSRGGSGDVLAGMIAGLSACGLPPAEAAACGVWLHGAAADETARKRGQYGMLPHDLFDSLGQLFAAAGR